MKPASHFVELNKRLHDRKSFDCGEVKLNSFLNQFALRHKQAGISKTMVLPSSEDSTQICAYYTLSHTEIERETLPKEIAKRLLLYPIPVLLIAQLAVHKKVQGYGLGKVTLIRSLKHILEINEYLPSNAVVVDAISSEISGFYTQFGFKELFANERFIRFYLPMITVERLFDSV